MRTRSAAAFFGVDFNQTLGKKDEPGHLHPFGDDVADYLSPFTVSLHSRKQEGPANPGDYDEYQQKMPMQKIEPRESLFSFDPLAIGLFASTPPIESL